jgi:hypothetical protein
MNKKGLVLMLLFLILVAGVLFYFYQKQQEVGPAQVIQPQALITPQPTSGIGQSGQLSPVEGLESVDANLGDLDTKLNELDTSLKDTTDDYTE